MIVTETERLIIRHYIDEDLPAFIEMNADDEVMKYFPSTKSEDQSIEYFERFRKRIAETGKCFWAVELKENKDFIGFIGLSEPNFEADFIPCTEIGWRLRKKYWAKGYATEGAKACLQVGWSQYGLKEILSMATVENAASIHVMEKIGMQYVKKFHHPLLEDREDLQPCVLYSCKPENLHI